METGIRKHKTNKTPRVTASVKFPHVGKSRGLTKVFFSNVAQNRIMEEISETVL